jgi:type VI secretion system protein ImpH
MAREDGREDTGLNRELLRAPYRFDFFQAVRLLERRMRDRARRDPGLRVQPVGHHGPGNEVVTFRTPPSLGFPAGTISQLHEIVPDPEQGLDAPATELVVAFLGLTGPNGALPRHYTELLIQRVRAKDYSLRDFFDLFNHRLISLFFRAWEKYRLPVGYERAHLYDRGGPPDLVTLGLYCLVGIGTDGLRGRLDLNDEVFLHYSGHFAHYPRSASALECLLEDYLGMPTRVLQIQGRWLRLSSDDVSVIPGRRHPRGRNNELGVNLTVGKRIWDVQSRFRLRIGPLTWTQFRSLMPDGPNLRPLCQVTRMFVGPDLDFDVQPVLRPDEVRPCRLNPAKEAGPYLAWNTWLPGRPRERPVDDAVFQPRER